MGQEEVSVAEVLASASLEVVGQLVDCLDLQSMAVVVWGLAATVTWMVCVRRVLESRAIQSLIATLGKQDSDVRQTATVSLAQLVDVQTLTASTGWLSANYRPARVRSLKTLSLTCKDETDCKLLSRDIDAFEPFLDPQGQIGEEHVQRAAQILGMSADEVRRCYEALAERFPWHPAVQRRLQA